ncbi:MAG: hypothetical protein ACJ8AI_07015 [Rhodopila sp.]
MVRYALAGLRRCWMPDAGRWSHRYHLDGRAIPNESRPHSDIYYSINVLLGLARVRDALAMEPYDVSGLFRSLCEAMPRHGMRNGAWGMALWAAAELGLDVPGVAADALRRLIADADRLSGWTAQDLGLTLSGVAAQLRYDHKWMPLAADLRDLLLAQFKGPRSLFRDSSKGPRRYFATFATQVYATLALYQFAEITGDPEALAAANACVTKLIELQGSYGEWPWFYEPRQELVLDQYEVYSVHQHGMAPAILHHAHAHGVAGARAAIERGLGWIFGSNEMGISMLAPSLQLIYRSQARQGVQGHRMARLLRAAMTASIGHPSPAAAGGLRLTREMRSYEFGWLLWSFGDRIDYPALTHHPAFSACAPDPLPSAA